MPAETTPHFLEMLTKSPADKIVTIVLILAIVILQLVRLIRPPTAARLEFDSSAFVAELRAFNKGQTAVLEGLRTLIGQQTILIERAMERQSAASEKLGDVHAIVEDIRLSIAGGERPPRRRGRNR